jgi:hypothetical protein
LVDEQVVLSFCDPSGGIQHVLLHTKLGSSRFPSALRVVQVSPPHPIRSKKKHGAQCVVVDTMWLKSVVLDSTKLPEIENPKTELKCVVPTRPKTACFCVLFLLISHTLLLQLIHNLLGSKRATYQADDLPDTVLALPRAAPPPSKPSDKLPSKRATTLAGYGGHGGGRASNGFSSLPGFATAVTGIWNDTHDS